MSLYSFPPFMEYLSHRVIRFCLGNPSLHVFLQGLPYTSIYIKSPWRCVTFFTRFDYITLQYLIHRNLFEHIIHVHYSFSFLNQGTRLWCPLWPLRLVIFSPLSGSPQLNFGGNSCVVIGWSVLSLSLTSEIRVVLTIDLLSLWTPSTRSNLANNIGEHSPNFRARCYSL